LIQKAHSGPGPRQKDCVLISTIASGMVTATVPQTAFGTAHRIAFGVAIPGIPPGLISFLPFILIIVVFYFLLIRPNQKKQQTWQQMLSSLKPGDRVTTTGGIRGIILNIKEDAIQLRIPPDNIKIEVVKSAIASVTTEEAAK
jgi:preprotein translocase subunit YajC